MTVYLTVEQLVQINREMVQSFGGLAGLRDRGSLEAAAARPRTGYYRDLIEEGAALCESLLQNHPFLDGNKRTAVTATAVFYAINGYSLRFVDLDLFAWLTNLLETGRVNRIELDRWFRAHVVQF